MYMNNPFKKKTLEYDYKYLKEKDLEGKVTLEQIQKVSPMLNETNPMTYSIFLALNEKLLSDAEKAYFQYLIKTMFDYESKTMGEISKILKEREEEPVEEQLVK